MKIHIKVNILYNNYKKMSASSKYQKLTQIEHVLKRPDTYVGSLHLHDSEEYIIDDNDKIQMKKIN